jgi:predicted ABC-class ATPase
LPGQSATSNVDVSDITVESLFGEATVVEGEPETKTGEGGSVTFVNAAGETETVTAAGETEIVVEDGDTFKETKKFAEIV